MTIYRLHKILEACIKAGHGRKPVAINKPSYFHVLEEDGAVILEVVNADLLWIYTTDDDGGIKENKDGTQAGKTMLVLDGGGRRG